MVGTAAQTRFPEFPSPDEARHLRACWALLEPQRERVGSLFYAHLFEAEPALRVMFPADIEAQAAKLVATLNVVVNHLDNLGPLWPTVQELGQRHREWRVNNAHYALVEAALRRTFGEVLGPGFTPEAEAAWRAAYGCIAAAMMAAPEAPEA